MIFNTKHVPVLKTLKPQYRSTLLQSLYPFYPTYHTEYDVFDYVKHHVDPTFEYHQLIGRLHGQMLLLLADSLVLPLDPTPGSVQMEKEFAYLQSHLSRYNWFQTHQGSSIIGMMTYHHHTIYELQCKGKMPCTCLFFPCMK